MEKVLGIPGFQREKNLLQRLGKKNIRKLIWTKQRVCVLFKTSVSSSKCTIWSLTLLCPVCSLFSCTEATSVTHCVIRGKPEALPEANSLGCAFNQLPSPTTQILTRAGAQLGWGQELGVREEGKVLGLRGLWVC